jgi:hypothetical protein
VAKLASTAEEKALSATKLPAFNNVALEGIKSKVADMLDLIGRSGELFSTYTRHNISHVDAMLGHLDWLITYPTIEEMTPTDWLLITLSIYFHDLGMLTTYNEFDNRGDNEAFSAFMKRIETDPKSIDYLNRSKKMTEEERQTFFFQEFIREYHPIRIREWITGHHLRHWGKTVTPITDEISKMMEPFPSRFRENLALVCESHHKDNLNKLDIYPLCQPYGSNSLEMANVQYAALILRTVDLIHVTKDRTPSITYKAIKFSDPKSVKEWEKQQDTFSVRHAGRKFDIADENTHTIIVSADFLEERPFFALTEYIAWADTEIKQTKRWSDQSRQEHKDAEKFIFPWQGIRGDLRVEGNQPQQMRFDFDRGRLLDMLVGHAIYNDATVAIRELLQNSIDAVRFQYYLDRTESEKNHNSTAVMGKVRVIWDVDSRTLTIEDNGIGMDLDIIKFHLMKVGSSFYDTPQFTDEYKGFTPISRFGIGILTCFMISDDIEIVTIKSSSGYRIRMSTVHADYLIRELQVGDIKLTGIEPHGTKISLVLRDGIDINDWSIEDILRYWVILPECDVEYYETSKPIKFIGFKTPAKALEYYYQKNSTSVNIEWKNIEILSKQIDTENGSYDFAFSVETGWHPEKTFAPPPEPELPAICIEGIRVADELPGFEATRIDAGPCALISVRGARGLRTTVSRSGLEVDEKYIEIAKICAKLFVEHVADEITRISEGHGNPLSRSSTAGRWLSYSLYRWIENSVIDRYVNEMRNKLPLIVIEKIDKSIEPPVVQRELISPELLAKQEYFWTIESRLVDSLGIISRDLGRELSINQFISSLAPEHVELCNSPILPDALLFFNDIWMSHEPDVVNCSRRYQQTSIKWCPGSNGKLLTLNKDDPFHNALSAEWHNRKPNDLHRLNNYGNGKIAIAEILGDIEGIDIVITRIAYILKKGTVAANCWAAIVNACNMSLSRRDAASHVSASSLETLFLLCINEVGGRKKSEYEREAIISDDTKKRLWREQLSDVNRFLQAENIKGVIPESLDFFDSLNAFDASSYWRNWNRE